MAVKRKHEDVSARDGDDADDMHPSRKVRVGYGETNTKLAKIYSDLADDVAKTRITAAASLIRAQADFATDERKRIVDRLIRGLCSNRKAARSGFFIALSELLSLAVKGSEAGNDEYELREIPEKIITITTTESTSSKRVCRVLFTELIRTLTESGDPRLCAGTLHGIHRTNQKWFPPQRPGCLGANGR